jgi:hypothetical protein
MREIEKTIDRQTNKCIKRNRDRERKERNREKREKQREKRDKQRDITVHSYQVQWNTFTLSLQNL